MSAVRPVIALTPYYNQEKQEPYMRPAYLNAIRAAGGVPFILPPELDEDDLKQLLSMADGVLFTGGPDVHPFLFGEETQARCGNVSPVRDTLELNLLRLAMDQKKPILGICRGIQLLNIGLGGDIYQDIPSQFSQDFPIAHEQPFYYDIPSHHVTVIPGTLLARLTGADVLQVNSMHHQAVRRLAPGLTACAHAAGPLTEAIELPDYPFFLGVQWHPEYLWENDPAAAAIFSGFVKAAAVSRRR